MNLAASGITLKHVQSVLTVTPIAMMRWRKPSVSGEATNSLHRIPVRGSTTNVRIKPYEEITCATLVDRAGKTPGGGCSPCLCRHERRGHSDSLSHLP